MDVLARIQQLMDQRGWTIYRLAKESHVNEVTIGNNYRRGTQPSISTLEALCKGFGISLSQFFAQDEMVELTPELREMFTLWSGLSDEQKNAVASVMRAFCDSKR